MSVNRNPDASDSSGNTSDSTNKSSPGQVPYTIPYTGSSGEFADGECVPSSSMPDTQMKRPTHGSMGTSIQSTSQSHGAPTAATHPSEPNFSAARRQEDNEEKNSLGDLDATQQPLAFAKSKASSKDASAGH